MLHLLVSLHHRLHVVGLVEDGFLLHLHQLKLYPGVVVLLVLTDELLDGGAHGFQLVAHLHALHRHSDGIRVNQDGLHSLHALLHRYLVISQHGHIFLP